jgi:hypothetical protein
MQLIKKHHVFKILEKIIEGGMRNIVKIDDTQFSFMTGKVITDSNLYS